MRTRARFISDVCLTTSFFLNKNYFFSSRSKSKIFCFLSSWCLWLAGGKKNADEGAEIVFVGIHKELDEQRPRKSRERELKNSL